MEYKKVVAFSNTCVLFHLENDFFALVAVDDQEARNLVTISKYAESQMKLAVYKSGEEIDTKTLKLAEEALKDKDHVYICNSLPEELERFIR